jgi:uncharacterized membrane protein YdjX (TVP38/TMEM64 family)
MTREGVRKTLAAAAVAAAVGLFFALDGPAHLSLDALKASSEGLTRLYAERPAAMILGYCLLYVAVAALNLPGAAALTLAGSAVFGFWPGLLAVSFASSLGATLACALSRSLLRDLVRSRLGQAARKIDEGIASEGAWYLFSMRLVPVIPFFLVNMAMGLTAMPLGRFYWVSQLGMLPGTAVYANAGAQLGRIESLADILSPGLLGAFALLAAFPLAGRWALKRFRGAPNE